MPAPVRAGAWTGLLLAAASAGCAAPSPQELLRYCGPDRLARGLTVVVPGVRGPQPETLATLDGLADGGVDGEIRVFDWSAAAPGDGLANLSDLDRNRAWARRLAAMVLDYRARFPGRPVRLVGHSGGSGMVLFALEQLPEGPDAAAVDSAALLASAVSPGYDLSRAIRAVRGRVFAFHSLNDPLLFWGMLFAGTMDRRNVPGAGYGGFETPADPADPRRRDYARLEQTGWHPGLILEGNLGDHLGMASRGFVARHVAPRLLR